MVNYFFHKNIVFGLSLFYFNAFTRFSGGMNYDEFYISIYNVVFTVLPPVIVGIFDQDVPREACYRYPGLYRQGINNSYFNWRARAGWVTSAVIQSVLVFFPSLYATGVDAAWRNGQEYSLWMSGVTTFSVVVITVHLQLIIGEDVRLAVCRAVVSIQTACARIFHAHVRVFVLGAGQPRCALIMGCHSSVPSLPSHVPHPAACAAVMDFWNWLHHLSIWASIAVWYLYLLVYGAFPPDFTVTENTWFLFVVSWCKACTPKALTGRASIASRLLNVDGTRVSRNGQSANCAAAGRAFGALDIVMQAHGPLL